MILLVLIALAARVSAAPREDPFALAQRYADALTGVVPSDTGDADARPAASGEADLRERDDNDRAHDDEQDDHGDREDDVREGSSDATTDAADPVGAEAEDGASGVRDARVPPGEPDAHLLHDTGDRDEGDVGQSDGEPQPDRAAHEDPSFELAGAPLDQADDLGLRTWSLPTVPLDAPPDPAPNDLRASRWGRLDLGLTWRRRWSEPRHAPGRRADEVWLLATWRR